MSKINKRVSFSDDVKKNDGLRPESEEFDEYVHNMFNNLDKTYWHGMRKTFSKGEKRYFAENLFLRFCDLYDRVERRGTVPVIACGGGRHNMVDKRHSRWIWKEIVFLREILEK